MKGDPVVEGQLSPPVVLGVEDEVRHRKPAALHASPPQLCDPREMERAELEAYLQSPAHFPTKNSLIEFARRYDVPVNTRTQREEIIRLCLRMLHDIPAGFAGLRAAEREPVVISQGDVDTKKVLESFFTGARGNEHDDTVDIKKITTGLLDSVMRCHEAAVLLAQVRHADSEVFAHAVEVCEGPVETHIRLLNELLDFARLAAGTVALAPVPFHLRDTIGDTLKVIAMAAHQKGLEVLYEVEPEVPEVLVGDSLKLQQVLMHLVNNAVKYTERGEVVVEVCRVEGSKQKAEGRVDSPEDCLLSSAYCILKFAVRDTGIGISKEKLRALTRLFSRTEGSPTHKSSTNGLGLVIAKRLVDLMGGQMEVHSESDGGSTFSFTVQLQTGPLSAGVVPNHLTTLAGQQVLVVEDNVTHRHLLYEMLSSWGLQLQFAANAREALALLYKARTNGTPFSLVLVDSHLPEMDGFAFVQLQHLKEDTSLTSPVVMMLASADSQKDITCCQELGVAAWVHKPVKSLELLHALVTALETRATTQDTEAVERTELWSLVAQDVELLRELIQVFWQSCPQQLFLLQQAILSGDCQSLLAATHALKGTLSNLTARRALRALALLEQIGLQGNLTHAQEALLTLTQEICGLKPVLTQILTQVEKEEAPTSSSLS
jgi:signal transduction histidine kinase/DNA-binding response OmpR family regulator